MGPAVSRAASIISFSAQLLSQDQDQPLPPLRDITTEERNRVNQVDAIKKVKRTRLLLDARTELTDDELRVCSVFDIVLLFDCFYSPRLLGRNISSLRIQSDERY